MNEQQRLWLLRVASLISLVVCGGVTVMLAWHRSSHPLIGPHSVPAAMAFLLALSGSILSLILTSLPNRTLTQFDRWLCDGLSSMSRDLPRGTPRQGILLGLLALGSYVIIASRFISANEVPRDDQLDYRRVAAEIRGMGGISMLLRQLWNGTYTESNRHPFYPILLSFLPGFTTAKWLSFYLGLFPLTTIWWLTVRRAGWLVGGVIAVLLATNSTIQQSASIVACEIILVGWVLLAWFTIEHCMLSARAIGPDPVRDPRLFIGCLLVGVWLGLAYLTKASAVFLFVGFLAWSLSVPRLRRWSWLSLLSFVVISSPLLVRNAHAFGDPLYSFNTRFLFSDTFEQGLGREFHGTRQEAREYLQSHTPGQITRRMLDGLGWEAYILLRSLGPATLGESRPFVGLLLVLFAILGAIGTERRMRWLAASWCFCFYWFFAWYVPIASGDRFLAPIVPVLLIFSARGVVSLLASEPKATPDQVSRRILYSAVLWGTTVTILAFARHPNQPLNAANSAITALAARRPSIAALTMPPA